MAATKILGTWCRGRLGIGFFYSLVSCEKVFNMRVGDELRTHWIDLLTPLFPNEAKIEIDPDADEFKVRVIWKLGTDPNRPNKNSKIILVIVPKEAAEDYENKAKGQRESDDRKLCQFVSNSLASHDPEHDNPSDSAPPVVEWVAGIDVLNS